MDNEWDHLFNRTWIEFSLNTGLLLGWIGMFVVVMGLIWVEWR